MSLGIAVAQDAPPLMLGQPQTPPRAVAPVPSAKTAAAKPAAKPTTPKPIAKTAAKPAAPAAGKQAKAVKPPAKPSATDAAARAAKLAAITAQPVPPHHDHVFEAPKPTACANPNAIGVSRVMKVDTTGGFYVGSTYHTRLPLEPKAVVLTFDDGPMGPRTDRVLKALDEECTKATFFIVGQMAKAYPQTLRKTAAAGHTIGYHTMTHPLNLSKWPLDKAENDVRSGWQTVDQILYGHAGDRPATPFFRYPGLFNSRALNEWFNSMDMGVWTINAAGNDWLKGHLTQADGPNVMNEALKELEASKGGILLLHDIKDSSSSIVGPLLKELKVRGFKIVQIVPKNPPPKLVAGPIEGITPTIENTAAPLAERSVDNFDAARQLAQMNAGRDGKSSTAPLPAYGAATAKPTIVPIAATPVTAPTAPVAEPETTGSVATTPAKSDGWFSATATSFRGLGGALGLW
ncbi:MAG: polysaccharide deacetylase family protein [Phyllobacteriaceae bacterium]|nr:polysaccharide deacetylase family protein [Phyllobacteriaceae bacterium]